MQGDIFQLHEIQQGVSKSGGVASRTTMTNATIIKPKAIKPQVSSAEVSIWNEDDLSELLFLQQQPIGHLNVKSDTSALENHAHFLERITAAFDDYYTDVDTHDSSDECAVFSDTEDDEDEPRPVVDRAPTTPTPAKKPAAEAAPLRTQPQVAAKGNSTDAVNNGQHVESISGPLMSWWPLPIEMQEHEWAARDDAAQKSSGRPDGDIMNWWPPRTPEDYEWKERFYE